METLYLGGYTRSNNCGIHLLQFNPQKKTIATHHLLIEEQNPTYFTLSKDGNHLYTLSEKERPGVSHYQKIGKSFHLVDHLAFGQGNGCHLSLDEDRQLLYQANYHAGSLAVLAIAPNGRLTLQDQIYRQGQGPHPHQDKSHCHFIHLDPTGNYLLACDLGSDQVLTYTLTPTNTLHLYSTYHSLPGSGPRHFIFHPNGHIVYIINELTATLDIARFQDGTLTRIGQVLSQATPFPKDNSAAALKISQNGRFLYVSNRGANTLSCLQISPDGQSLTLLQTLPSGGDFPRDFTLFADDQFLLVGHQKEAKITLFERDAQTGLLTLLPTSAPLDEIVCCLASD